MTGKISNITAREVMTSKGTPTIEVDVLLDDGHMGRASAPGGTSRGMCEAVDLLDGNPTYFNGLGVFKAISVVKNEIAEYLKKVDPRDQERIDGLLIELDGTVDKSRLGGNTIVATSIATAKAAAASIHEPLYIYLGGGHLIPLPFVHVMFGGPAYVGLSGVTDFQEYAIIPLRANTYKDGYLAALSVGNCLRLKLAHRTGHGVPNYNKIAGMPVAHFDSNEEALETITQCIIEQGYEPKQDMGIYLDVAASQLYREGLYHLTADQLQLSSEAMIDYFYRLCRTYPVVALEDPLFEEDWSGWQMIRSKLDGLVDIIGDDLFVTNSVRLNKGIEMRTAHGLIIKPNQIGTLTETYQTVKLAKESKMATIISPRSGEIWDPYLAHLCVGWQLGQGKIAGAYPSGELHFNELTRIVDMLGNGAQYADGHYLSTWSE